MTPEQTPILVCGLGSLGQACLKRLLEFDHPLVCIDQQPPQWQSAELRTALAEGVILGDMRLPSTLKAAGVQRARSVLILSSDNTINLETALQVRLLNHNATVVVRSSSQQGDLNRLLERRITNLITVDPQLLTAGAIAQAMRKDAHPATFRVDGVRIRLGRSTSLGVQRPLQLEAGDLPTTVNPMMVQVDDGIRRRHRQQLNSRWIRLVDAVASSLRDRWTQIITRVFHPTLLEITLALAVLLILLGLMVYGQSYGTRSSLFATFGLLKGEFVDPVNVLIEASQGDVRSLPVSTLVLTLIYALFGTLLTSAVMAFMTDQLLSNRLGLRRRRPPRRNSSMVLVMDGKHLGNRVAERLQSDNLSIVRVHQSDHGEGVSLETALRWSRRTPLQGAALLSRDLMANLRLALELQEQHPQARLVIATKHLPGADALGDLLGGISVIESVGIAADALVATAFGEEVREIRRVDGSNLMLVRYLIDARDTLHDLSVSRLQCGYGVTVLAVRRRSGTASWQLLPKLEWPLNKGEEALVLADLKGLRRVEQGAAICPRWRVRFRVIEHSVQAFDTQQCLARHLNMPPGQFKGLMNGEEHLTPPMDHDLAMQLMQGLRRIAVESTLEESATAG